MVLSSRGAGGEPCRIIESAFGGAMQLVLVEVAGHRLTAEVPSGPHLWRPGEAATLTFLPGSARVFEIPSRERHSRSDD
ncbi:TOBE domain-containing protein, partial [Acinetobacter baumannii]|uniref:TOBE domain-containing protein n=1 Tax=Acinetobacter baumannii TaxID=470 RepID=UPI00338D8270